MSQAQHEYEVMRQLEEEQYAQALKAAEAERLAQRWPQLRAWPGKPDKSPVLSSGNVNAVKDAAQRSRS